MKQWANKQTGFTIVELLIVVVVIAILAAITIVSYSGIRDRAQISSVQSQLSQVVKKVLTSAVLNAEAYPATLDDVDIKDGNGVTYQYTSNNAVTPKTFCITATLNQTRSYYVSEKTGSSLQDGICPEHNLLVWYEDVAGAPPPLPLVAGVGVDSTVKRGGTSSLRLNSGTVGIYLRNSPHAVATGQTITVSLWLKTDLDWNGSTGNSKIRFGAGSNGAFISACTYPGVKADWTFVTCSYTSNGSSPTITPSVGNDGSLGRIWIDDMSLVISGS